MPSHVGVAPTRTATSIVANAVARAVGVRGIVFVWLQLRLLRAMRASERAAGALHVLKSLEVPEELKIATSAHRQ